MTTKKKVKYIAPTIQIIPVETEGLLETISLKIGQGDAQGSGDAKGGYFDDEVEEETNPNPWDEPLF